MITPTRSDVRVRPVEDADRAFLEEVYGSVRAEELAPLAWTVEQTAAFVAMQFDAQDREWRSRYDAAGFLVVLVDDVPVGRLYLDRRVAELRLVDIALVPAQRGRGLGSSLLRDVIALGDTEGRTVTLHVERSNPARRLYERLGFRVAGEGEVHVLLERPPTRAPATEASPAPQAWPATEASPAAG